MKSINFCFKNTGCPHKFGICQKQCSEAEKCLRAKRATCTKLTDFALKKMHFDSFLLTAK